jgi:hypothetical protein
MGCCSGGKVLPGIGLQSGGTIIMKTARMVRHQLFVGVAVIASCQIWVISTQAQSQGNNAVWGSGSSPAGSAAFIDASAFLAVPPVDICATLYSIISSSSYPAGGAVIDARGINATNSATDGNGNMTCAYSPWSNGSASTTNPATILLPAGYNVGCMGCSGNGNIIISQAWTLPNGSKIIGEGPNAGLNATLEAAGSGFNTNYGAVMIQMGSSASGVCPLVNSNPVCTGVAVEHITLEASNLNIDGIDNEFSQEGSYVNDVTLNDIGGTGLSVGAPNSGPYTDLYYLAETSCGTTCPVCVMLNAGTLGIHGMTCIGSSTTATSDNAAIYVNAANNSIEDVHVEAFGDAIQIGDVASGTIGNIFVKNLSAGLNGTRMHHLVNTVHICGPNYSSQFGSCAQTGATVEDVVVLQATNLNGNTGTVYSTIVQDDVTGTSITPASAAEGEVGMYVLGEQVGGNGYQQNSRLTTSPSNSANGTAPYSTAVSTWLSGTGTISGSCQQPGALYSNASGSSGSAIYVCKWATGTSLQWADLK